MMSEGKATATAQEHVSTGTHEYRNTSLRQSTAKTSYNASLFHANVLLDGSRSGSRSTKMDQLLPQYNGLVATDTQQGRLVTSPTPVS